MTYNIFVSMIFVLSLLSSCGNDNNTNPVNNNIESVTIGSQVWMKRNLDVSTYSNGDVIPQITDSTEWINLTTGAWCYYDNDPANGAVYGKLYNWYAVNDPRGLAPSGYHVPSDTEWSELSTYLGGVSVAGGIMKESSTTHWKSPNKGAINSCEFTALQGGSRFNDGVFNNLYLHGNWWLASERDVKTASYWSIFYNSEFIYGLISNKVDGFSVRCIKDK